MGCWATATKREWLEKNTWEKTALLEHFCKDTLSWNVRGELTNLNVTGLSGFRFHLSPRHSPSHCVCGVYGNTKLIAWVFPELLWYLI